MNYIHPSSKKIKDFVSEVVGEQADLKNICQSILSWFDINILYSRLNAPFFPLQRSDLDVLEMKSGTCGDYANLIVSILLFMGFEAGYAYVHRDCYGDEQDHICVAVKREENWILIDATQPYRTWYGFDCPHEEYKLLTPNEFEVKMKEQEQYWISIAEQFRNEKIAGLLYAPWIHEEIVQKTEDVLDSVFFLLIIRIDTNPILYAYYKRYTKKCGVLLCMASISNQRQVFQFSIHRTKSLWDDGQWSEEYLEDNIPSDFRSKELEILKTCINKIEPKIQEILKK